MKPMPIIEYVYTVHLSDSVTLGAACGRGGASSASIVSRDVLQWAVGTQQQRRRGLLMPKAQIAA